MALYKQGHGYNGIARQLNELDVKSPRKPTKHDKRLWGEGSVRTILSNPVYTGRVTFGKVMTERDPETGKVRHIVRPESEWRTAHDESLRIISDADFEEVKRIRASRNKGIGKEGKFTDEQRRVAGLNKAKSVYPFSGILCCKDCGGPMNIFKAARISAVLLSVAATAATASN